MSREEFTADPQQHERDQISFEGFHLSFICFLEVTMRGDMANLVCTNMATFPI